MTDIDVLIGSELERMLPLPDGGLADWGDVMRRAGLAGRPRSRRRRALLLAVAMAVIGLLIAVPAFGLDRSVIHWIAAPAAPAPEQKSFQELDVGAPAGMAPNVSGSARSVMESEVDGRDAHFWVAPTAAGGFCFDLEGYGGGCDRDRQLPMDPSLAEHTLQTSPVLFGDALPPGVDHIEVTFANDQSVSIPVVYVSSPIDAAFFVYQLPGAGPHVALWPAKFEAVRGDGTIVASATIGQGWVHLLGSSG